MIGTAVSTVAPTLGAAASFGLSAVPELIQLARGNSKLKGGAYAGLDIPTAWARIQKEHPGASVDEVRQLFGLSPQNPQASNSSNASIPALPNGVIMPNQPMSEIPPGGVLPNPAAPGIIPPPAAPGLSPLDVLGKIFGLPTGGGQGTIDALIKLGVPLTGAVLNGLSASKAASTQANAANNAAQLTADAAKNSLDFSKQVYGDEQTQTAPYRAAGTAALDKIQALLGIGGTGTGADATAELQKAPGYQLNLSEGLKAINNASRGVVNGQTLKAAGRFANDYAGNYLDKTLGQLDTVAGLGQTGVGQNQAAGASAVNTNTGVTTNAATNIGQDEQQAAAARASGYGNGVFSQVLNTLGKQQQQRQSLEILSRLGL